MKKIVFSTLGSMLISLFAVQAQQQYDTAGTAKQQDRQRYNQSQEDQSRRSGQRQKDRKRMDQDQAWQQQSDRDYTVEGMVIIDKDEIPSSLKKTLKDDKYSGWENATIYHNTNTGEYVIAPRAYRFDEQGKEIEAGNLGYGSRDGQTGYSQQQRDQSQGQQRTYNQRSQRQYDQSTGDQQRTYDRSTGDQNRRTDDQSTRTYDQQRTYDQSTDNNQQRAYDQSTGNNQERTYDQSRTQQQSDAYRSQDTTEQSSTYRTDQSGNNQQRTYDQSRTQQQSDAYRSQDTTEQSSSYRTDEKNQSGNTYGQTQTGQSESQYRTEDMIIIHAVQVPASLRRTLSERQYEGWEENGKLYMDRATDEYVLIIEKSDDNSQPRSYRFDKNGKLKEEESGTSSQKRNDQ